MCGRFTLTYEEREQLASELGVRIEDVPASRYRPRFNIAPTDDHWIVRQRLEDRELVPAKWGLVNSWARDIKGAARQINARAETIATTPAFRDAFGQRRCVVPSDGFIEWIRVGKNRQPVWFHRSDGGLLLFAGLYESWQPPQGDSMRTFTIITTDANSEVSSVHNRMPVVLGPDEVDEWLYRDKDPVNLTALLRPAPEGLLVGTLVSSRVNSVANDDVACLEPVAQDPPEYAVARQPQLDLS